MRAALALPGAITTLTGGTIYDRLVVEELRHAGWDMAVITLPEGFPFPTEAAMATACAQLAALPADRPVVIDGLAFGALPTAAVAAITAPIAALVHHPLAHESGLAADQVAALWARERANLAYAAHVLVPSPHTAAMLVARYDVPAAKITIALPGITRPASAPPPPPPAQPLILSVGILHPRKGHDVLIAALARITDLPWQAVIVGNPWESGYQAQLQAQITATGAAARITLAGRMAQEPLNQLYAQAHVFALATRYEGYGIVFNEALVHGLPILSCATGAVPDTVPQAAGILVPVADDAAFAAGLRALLTDPARHAALAAAARVAGAALPSWADTAATVAMVLRGLGR